MQQEKIIQSFDGTELYFTKHLAKNPKATIVIVHGLGEHCGRYEYVTQKLLSFQYNVYRFDHRGHGKSGGARGYLDNFHKYIDDTNYIVQIAKQENKNCPVFMLGHSMGGFVTAAYGVKYPNELKGQILSGACTTKLPAFDDLKKLDVKNEPLTPVPNGLPHLICRSQAVVEDYKNDPLVLKNFTLKLMISVFFEGVDWLTANIQKYSYPCIIMHGENDQIVPKECSHYLYNHGSSQDKTLKIFPELYHEILNEEQEKDSILEEIHNWVENRL